MRLTKIAKFSTLVTLLLAMAVLCGDAVTRVGVMAAEIQSASEFTVLVVQKLRLDEHVARASSSRELAIRLVLNGEEGPTEIELNLANVYLEYRENPTGRDAIIRNFVGSTISSLVVQFKPTAKNIVAIVRSEDYLLDFGEGKSKNDFVYEPLAADVIVVYAIETPTATFSLLADRLDEFGVKRSEVPEIAKANLDSVFRGADFQPQQGGNEFVKIIVGGGAYLTSLLLMDSYWTRERFPFKGDPVVYVLARETMLVTGSGESVGIELAASLAAKEWESLPYRISQQPLVRRNGSWQSFHN